MNDEVHLQQNTIICVTFWLKYCLIPDDSILICGCYFQSMWPFQNHILTDDKEEEAEW